MNRHQHRYLYQKKPYNRSYFEGWYYKQVTADGKHTISFIPGVNFKKKSAHGFLQVIHLNDRNELKTYMIDYPIEAFSPNQQPFHVKLGENEFSLEGIKVQVESKNLTLSGNIEFEDIVSLKTSFASPNIMGWFSYVPFMECNHDIISMYHTLSGSVNIDETSIDFSGGIGYIEKDWGRSFPQKYVWIQSNHFEDKTTCLFCSVATIPILFFSFEGFICNLIHQGIEYRFATYNGSSLIINNRSDSKVHMKFKNKEFSLEIKGEVMDAKNLIAPKLGAMDKIIKEGLSGKVSLHLKNHLDETILESTSNMCGMELVESLLPK